MSVCGLVTFNLCAMLQFLSHLRIESIISLFNDVKDFYDLGGHYLTVCHPEIWTSVFITVTVVWCLMMLIHHSIQLLSLLTLAAFLLLCLNRSKRCFRDLLHTVIQKVIPVSNQV